MPQARSTATRAKIIAAAVDLFHEKSYAATSLGEIVERSAMTKGAFYYHFDSKEALASAIVDEGSAIVLDRFQTVCASSAPAFENMIHGTFVIGATINEDRTAQMAAVLARALSGSSEAPNRAYRALSKAFVLQAERAAEEGDLSPNVQPEPVAELVLFTILGAELVTSANPNRVEAALRLQQIWQTLLPALIAPEALPYFREYLARETMPRG